MDGNVRDGGSEVGQVRLLSTMRTGRGSRDGGGHVEVMRGRKTKGQVRKGTPETSQGV